MLSELLSVFLQNFLEIVLPVLATALAGLAVAWITKIVNDLKIKLSDEQEFIINQAIYAAVLAAEQANLSGFITDKKKYAFEIAENWLLEKGIVVDIDILDARIEAAVFNEFNRGKDQAKSAGFDLSSTVAGTD